MMHDQWTDQLSAYLDDELPERERLSVERHLAECAECRHALQQLRRVVTTAAALPSQPPESELWHGIARRIDGPAAARFDRGRRRFSFTLPEIAAASVLLAMISGGTVAIWMAAGRTPQSGGAANVRVAGTAVPGDSVDAADPVGADDPRFVAVGDLGDPQYEAAVLDLERAVESGRGWIDPGTVAVVEDNLSIIDRAIAEARSALASDPSNGYLSGHLVETRRRKLDLLRRTAALVAEAR